MTETATPVRTTAQNAQLALLLEVSSTPKPGNVDREREYDDLRFEHFVAGAVGAFDGLKLATEGGPLGRAFERAVAGMSQQRGGNTQFGAILLLIPLVRAASTGRLTQARARDIVASTTVEDAIDFYRAFDHISVAVDDPPPETTLPDVRLGADAAADLRDRELTFGDVMSASVDVDGIAREWAQGFPRTFDAATALQSGEGPVTHRAASVYLRLLASHVDTFVVTQHDEETAREVRNRAQQVLDGDGNVSDLAAAFVERKINPGTTADIVAGALFVALEGGMEV